MTEQRPRFSQDLRVLMPDDDPAALRYLLDLLGEQGHAAHGVVSGQVLVDVLKRHEQDWNLVLVDQARPDAGRLGELLALVRSGRVTAMAQWGRELAQQQPEFADFAAEVQQATQRLDFDALERLVEGAERA